MAPNHIRQQIPPVRRLVNKDPLVRIKMLPHLPAITDCSTRSGLRQAASEEKCSKVSPETSLPVQISVANHGLHIITPLAALPATQKEDAPYNAELSKCHPQFRDWCLLYVLAAFCHNGPDAP